MSILYYLNWSRHSVLSSAITRSEKYLYSFDALDKASIPFWLPPSHTREKMGHWLLFTTIFISIDGRWIYCLPSIPNQWALFIGRQSPASCPAQITPNTRPNTSHVSLPTHVIIYYTIFIEAKSFFLFSFILCSDGQCVLRRSVTIVRACIAKRS